MYWFTGDDAFPGHRKSLIPPDREPGIALTVDLHDNFRGTTAAGVCNPLLPKPPAAPLSFMEAL